MHLICAITVRQLLIHTQTKHTHSLFPLHRQAKNKYPVSWLIRVTAWAVEIVCLYCVCEWERERERGLSQLGSMRGNNCSPMFCFFGRRAVPWDSVGALFTGVCRRTKPSASNTPETNRPQLIAARSSPWKWSSWSSSYTLHITHFAVFLTLKSIFDQYFCNIVLIFHNKWSVHISLERW